MKRNLINEDSNQFGPGTDLIICLLAILMVMVMIVSFLYTTEKKSNEESKQIIANSNQIIANSNQTIANLEKRLGDEKAEGKFKLDVARFDDATFEQQKDTNKLTNPEKTKNEISHVIEKYKELNEQFPFIFVIGHANTMGKFGEDLSDEERLVFNWGVAGERSAVIANLLQNELMESLFPKESRNNIIIVSTGEFDLKDEENPTSAENAFVEVIFGKEWKSESLGKKE